MRLGLMAGDVPANMPFVTRLTMKSGDGDLLESVASELKERAERKGVELKGPHADPPQRYSVAQYKGHPDQGEFDSWEYTVYQRTIEIVEHHEFAREVTERSYPDRIHLSADIEQYSQVGDN